MSANATPSVHFQGRIRGLLDTAMKMNFIIQNLRMHDTGSNHKNLKRHTYDTGRQLLRFLTSANGNDTKKETAVAITQREICCARFQLLLVVKACSPSKDNSFFIWST